MKKDIFTLEGEPQARARKSSEVDWLELKTEYITTDITLKELAAKHNAALQTVNSRSARELWRREREKYRLARSRTMLYKTRQRQAAAGAQQLGILQDATSKIADAIDKALADATQLHRHRAGNDDGGEQVLQKIDDRAVRNLSSAMRDLSAVVRDLYDLPSLPDKAAILTARRRLDLDERRIEAGLPDPDDDGAGVVVLAPVDPGGEGGSYDGK